MNKGNELYSIIKCENRESTDALKELHYKVNDILYTWNQRYISPKLASQIAHRLTITGETISNLEIKNKKAEPKRKEILQAIKKIILSLRQYIKDYTPQPNDKLELQNMLKYQLYQYLKVKDKMTEDEILKYLKINKTIALDYDINEVDSKKFKEMQEELLDALSKKYRVS